jgi:CRP/FNR family transcriptional regulator, cyclic AMP receptor protein
MSETADLEHHPFVRGLGEEFVRAMAAHTTRRRYDTGTTIAREGDPAREFFLIHAGKVALELVPHDRPHLTILTLGPGEVFGWSWLVAPHRWRVDARAMKPTDVLVVAGGPLRALMDAHPVHGYQFLLRLVPILALRLDATRLQVLDVHAL